MTFDAFEKTNESSRPTELFELTLGGQQFFYTSGEDDQTVNLVDYEAVAIQRNKITRDPQTRGTVQVTVAGDNVFARKYISTVPGAEATMIIKRYQRGDGGSPEVKQLYEGIVRSVKFDKNGREATLSVDPARAGLSRPGPRFVFSSSCNNVLYDSNCKVSDVDTAFRYSTGVVTAINGSIITVSGAAAFTDDWFTGGYVEAPGGSDGRLILSQTGDNCTLLLPFDVGVVGVGSTVILFAGCAHDPTTCATKFTNFINYGGFPFVPAKNPFTSGIEPVNCN